MILVSKPIQVSLHEINIGYTLTLSLNHITSKIFCLYDLRSMLFSFVDTKENRNAKTPPPVHPSTKISKRWL